MEEATDDSNNIEKLYEFGEWLNEAKDKYQHRHEYEGIIAAANGSGKAKQLAVQLTQKFFKFFPRLAEQAIEHQWSV